MEIQSLIGSEKRLRERKEEIEGLPQNSEDAEIGLLCREETNAMSVAAISEQPQLCSSS
mgnify:CR=1 FL=1